jgi:hypothetical protein
VVYLLHSPFRSASPAQVLPVAAWLSQPAWLLQNVVSAQAKATPVVLAGRLAEAPAPGLQVKYSAIA